MMTRTTLFAITLLTLAASACSDDAICPAGFVRDGERCVQDSDSGTDGGGEDARVDAGTDAFDGGPDAFDGGPCGECESETPLCNPATMACVQCLTPTDCEGAAAMCSDSGTCVECLGNADCTEPDASVCSTDGAMAGSALSSGLGYAPSTLGTTFHA